MSDDPTDGDEDESARPPDDDEQPPDDELAGRVEAALRGVRDREAGMDVFEAGLVESVTVTDGRATVAADLGGFDPEGRESVAGAMVRAARSVSGVEAAHVEPAGPSVPAGAGGLADVDRVVAVASAKGGVGKTTVAATLACGLAADGPTALFDADIHGPNAPALLDVSGPVYADDEDRPVPVSVGGDGDLAVMSVGLLESGAPLAWRGAMAHDAVSELFAETAWGDRETLVVDLPPGTGDVVLTTLQEVAVDGVVVVTTPHPAAVADTNRSLALFRDNDVPVLGAVTNMATYVCPSCGDEHDLFPEDDPAVDAPVLASLPFAPQLQGTPRPGAVPDPAAGLADAVADRLDAVWTFDPPAGAVDVRGLDAEERRERVRTAFGSLDSGDRFDLVSDRDPSPVRALLADVAGVDPPDLDPFAVERATPETWHLRTCRP